MNDKNNNQKLPAADTGNASNPSPYNRKMEPVSDEQLLDEKAEKFCMNLQILGTNLMHRISKMLMK